MGQGKFLSVVAGASLFCAASIALAQGQPAKRPMPHGMMEMGKITAIDAASGTITVQGFGMRGRRGPGKPGTGTGNGQQGSSTGAKGSTGGNGSAPTSNGQGQARGARPMMHRPFERKLTVGGSTVVKDVGGQAMALNGLQVGDFVRVRGKFNGKTMEANEIQKSKVPARRTGK